MITLIIQQFLIGSGCEKARAASLAVLVGTITPRQRGGCLSVLAEWTKGDCGGYLLNTIPFWADIDWDPETVLNPITYTKEKLFTKIHPFTSQATVQFVKLRHSDSR